MADLPSFMGIPLKYISLVTLTFQNSGLILIMHYSRIMPVGESGRYFTSTAVFLNEIIKLIICFFVALHDRRKVDGSLSALSTNLNGLYADVFRSDSWKLAIPAALYTLQNSLQYIAVSNLDAASFQVTYQLKILTTALFSVTMLHRKLSARQWISLVLLTIGIAIVQIPTTTPDAAAAAPPVAQLPAGDEVGAKRRSLGSSTVASRLISRSLAHDSDTNVHIQGSMESEANRTVGLAAVTVACILSGLAGVYFEKVLKGSSATLWVRNIQLSFYSLFPAFFLGVLLKDGSQIAEKGFFNGYNAVVWTAITFQAAGGIIVALCVNFADNIAKNFATSISILLSSLASVYFFDFVITIYFGIGASLVFLATWLYSKPDSSPKPAQYTPLEKAVVEEHEMHGSQVSSPGGSGSSSGLGERDRYDNHNDAKRAD